MTEHEHSVPVENLGPAGSKAAERAAAGVPIVVTRAGRPVAVLLSVDAMRGLQRERALLRRLALGELESAAGDGEDLDAVLEDCRLLLEES
jgi:prevent-host-death family protein